VESLGIKIKDIFTNNNIRLGIWKKKKKKKKKQKKKKITH